MLIVFQSKPTTRIMSLWVKIIQGEQEKKQARKPGGSHIKQMRMLVISLRGVNFGFWSHYLCSGEDLICSRQGARLVLHKKK